MVYVYKRVSGTVSLLTQTSTPLHDGSLVRAVAKGGTLLFSVDGLYTGYVTDSDFAAGGGQPGIGGRQMPAGNAISLVQLGPLDSTAPAAVDSTTVGVTAFPTCVEIQWQGAADNPVDHNGIGIWYYGLMRGNDLIAVVYPAAAEDCTVAASTSYTYTIVPVDLHNNAGPGTAFTVTTPQAGAIDPRRIGVNALGNYWGGMGEQIDTRSGNLNFSLPLLKAQGRGGWSVPFVLSYNSQLWRHDSGGTWNMGKDVGFGYGWRLLAGSITPVMYGYFGIDHYLFTDSTSAEYRLDSYTYNAATNSYIWTSKQGVYVSYDATNQILYFPDGSFWIMGCTSTGNEDDAGSLYLDYAQNQPVERRSRSVGALVIE